MHLGKLLETLKSPDSSGLFSFFVAFKMVFQEFTDRPRLYDTIVSAVLQTALTIMNN